MGFPLNSINARNAEVLTARFAGNGTGTPTLTKGAQLTLARTGVGVYTLTINSASTARRKPTLCYSEAKAIMAGSIPLHGNVSLSAGVLTVTFFNASGTATDPGVGAVCSVIVVVE